MSDAARPRCTPRGSRSNSRSAQNCLEVYGSGVSRGSSGEHPVCHTPSRNGTRGLCPAGAAPTAAVQVAAAATSQERAPTPGWICGVPRKAEGCSSGMALEMSVWCGGTGLLPMHYSGPERGAEAGGADPAEGRLPASEPAPPVCATLPGQKLPSRLRFRNYPLSSCDPAGK